MNPVFPDYTYYILNVIIIKVILGPGKHFIIPGIETFPASQRFRCQESYMSECTEAWSHKWSSVFVKLTCISPLHRVVFFFLSGSHWVQWAGSLSPRSVTTPCSSQVCHQWESYLLSSGMASGRKTSSAPATPRLPSARSLWRSQGLTTTAAPGPYTHTETLTLSLPSYNLYPLFINEPHTLYIRLYALAWRSTCMSLSQIIHLSVVIMYLQIFNLTYTFDCFLMMN